MMDLTIDDIIKVIQSGGNIALIFGIYFGGKVLSSAKAAVTTFETIANDVAHVRKVVDKHIVRKEIHERYDD